MILVAPTGFWGIVAGIVGIWGICELMKKQKPKKENKIEPIKTNLDDKKYEFIKDYLSSYNYKKY